MAKKKRNGLLDDDFQSLTYKEKKSRIKDAKIPTVKDTNITGDKAIEYGFAGGKTLGKKNIGAIKTKAQEQNKTQKNGEDIYKDSDGKVVSKFDSNIDTTNKYKGRKANKLNRIEKRVAKRQGQKEERKNYRATKLAKRRGMSPEQAKDFMQNRRTRLNQALGEFGKGIMGREQNLSNIDDRMYRKKGTGTLQNMKSKDGGTYDATAPYKGTAEKGYADRGMKRKEKDGYTKVMGPKVNIPPADPIKLNAFRSADKPKEQKQNVQDNSTRNINKNINLTPTLSNYPEIEQGKAYSATANSTVDSNIFNKDQQAQNSQRSQNMGDPGKVLFDRFLNPDRDPIGTRLVRPWWQSSGMQKPFNEHSRDSLGFSTESFSDGNENFDRKTTQENMSNAWKKNFKFYKG